MAILLEIIGHGLLHIRSVGWSGDAKTCAAIADHIHNLPSLCRDFSANRLLYYWEAERLSFCNVVGVAEARGYQIFWQRLEMLIEAMRAEGDDF